MLAGCSGDTTVGENTNINRQMQRHRESTRECNMERQSSHPTLARHYSLMHLCTVQVLTCPPLFHNDPVHHERIRVCNTLVKAYDINTTSCCLPRGVGTIVADRCTVSWTPSGTLGQRTQRRRTGLDSPRRSRGPHAPMTRYSVGQLSVGLLLLSSRTASCRLIYAVNLCRALSSSTWWRSPK